MLSTGVDRTADGGTEPVAFVVWAAATPPPSLVACPGARLVADAAQAAEVARDSEVGLVLLCASTTAEAEEALEVADAVRQVAPAVAIAALAAPEARERLAGTDVDPILPDDLDPTTTACVVTALGATGRRFRHQCRRERDLWENAQTGALLPGLVHDLNNPLSSIIGYTQLLQRRDDLAPDVRADLGKIFDEAQRAADLLRSALRRSRPDRPPPAPARGQRHVLVVEDEPVLRDLLARMIESEGHTVALAQDGTGGLAAIASRLPDFVICDVHMPGLDGPGFFEQVVGRHPAMRERFLFITGDTVSSQTREFLSESGVRCLAKPFRLPDLMEILGTMLQDNEAL